MITLITFPAGFGDISYSPFCTKAVYLLNMAGVQWQRRDVDDPRRYPKAKLPAIETGGVVIGDSDNIRAHLEGLGHDLEPGLSDLDKANARAFVRMAEEHMYFHQVLDRWGNDAVWSVVRDEYFSAIPKLLRGFITNGLRKTLHKGMLAQGLGRLSESERLTRLEPDLQAISTRLQATPYLFGDRPTAADASVAALLGAMLTTPVETALRQRIAGDARFTDYVSRMRATLGHDPA